MAKNNAFINAMKQIKKESANITPSIYASIAIALHREYGFGYERINKVFAESQKIWESHIGDTESMIAKCEMETGIKLVQKEADNK